MNNEQASADAGEVQEKRKAIRLLIADDQKIMRSSLRVVLEREPDIEVIAEACDGKEALERVRECAPDLVLMDLAMPGMNGIEAIRRLHSEHPEVRVLAMSFYWDQRLVAKMFGFGVSGCVSKTAGSADLLQGVRSAAAGRRFLCRELTAIAGEVRQASEPGGGNGSLAQCENDVLQQVGKSQTSADIADHLKIAPALVEVHLRNIKRKLGLRSSDELASYA